ncbi:dTDP-fucopyranose mutase [Entomophthora muscae]|uniref:dTDP-fucopyranose mutase n=2 Tax=Entomophthora muscae TaxID=34485 RepID=A0ACC2TLP3_9FUNG|nr:dTDP-fucopyranose mutase [Entomophthora muscae]
MVLTRRQLKALKDAGIEPSPDDLFDPLPVTTPKRKPRAQSTDNTSINITELTRTKNKNDSNITEEATTQPSNGPEPENFIDLTLDNLADFETPRRRGRPSKTDVAKRNTPKRASSNKNILSSAEVSLANIETPKRRGRPPKALSTTGNSNINAVTSAEVSLADIGTPKRRGRPAKSTQNDDSKDACLDELKTSKKRGRPSKASQVNLSIDLPETHQTSPEAHTVASNMLDVTLDSPVLEKSTPASSEMTLEPNTELESTESTAKLSSKPEETLLELAQDETPGLKMREDLNPTAGCSLESSQSPTKEHVHDVIQLASLGPEESMSSLEHGLCSKDEPTVSAETVTQMDISFLQVSEDPATEADEDLSGSPKVISPEPAVISDSFVAQPNVTQTTSIELPTSFNEQPNSMLQPRMTCDLVESTMECFKELESPVIDEAPEQHHPQEDLSTVPKASINSCEEAAISPERNETDTYEFSQPEQLEHIMLDCSEKADVLVTHTPVAESNGSMSVRQELNEIVRSLPHESPIPSTEENSSSSGHVCSTVGTQDSHSASKPEEISPSSVQVYSETVETKNSTEAINHAEEIVSQLQQFPQNVIVAAEDKLLNQEAPTIGLMPLADDSLNPKETKASVNSEFDAANQIHLPSLEEAIQENIEFAEAQDSIVLKNLSDSPRKAQLESHPCNDLKHNSHLVGTPKDGQAPPQSKKRRQKPKKTKTPEKEPELPSTLVDSSQPRTNKKKAKKRKNKLNGEATLVQGAVSKKPKHSSPDAKDTSDLFQNLPGLAGPSFIPASTQDIPKSPPKATQQKHPQTEESSESEVEIDDSCLQSLLSQAKASAPKQTSPPSATKAFKNGKFLDPVGDLIRENLYIKDASHATKKKIAGLSCPLVKIQGLPSEIPCTPPTGLSVGAALASDKQKGVQELKMNFDLSHKLTKTEKTKLKESNAGAKWFNMPAPVMTPELKRDLELLSLRNVLDKKRFYKRSDKQPTSKFLQVGTIVEDKSEFYSARMTKKERQSTMVGEVLNDAVAQDYFKSRFDQIQQTGADNAKKPSQKRFKKKHSRQ